MSDKHIYRDDLDNTLVSQKMRDLGDTNTNDHENYATSVVDEGLPSSVISFQKYSNTNLDTLISTVTSYLASSTKRFKAIAWFAWGTVTATYHAVITESTI